MLEENTISRIGYFIVIGLLVTTVMFLGYKVGSHEGDMKAIGIEKEYTKAENESLKETLRSYIQYVEYYRQMFSRALKMTKDETIFLKKDTLIIPPPPPEAKVETKQASQ